MVGIFATYFRYGRLACVERQLGVIPGCDAADADNCNVRERAETAYTYSFSLH